MTLNPPLSPGQEVSVEVLADGNDTVALENDGVAIEGESNGRLQVRRCESGDQAIGVLKDDPQDFTQQSDFSDGDSAGLATMYLGHTVLNVATDSGYTPTVDDYVRFTDGGDVEQHHGPTATSVNTVSNALGHDGNDPAGLETEDGSDTELDLTGAWPWGKVIGTTSSGEFNVPSGTVAVARLAR